jgi:PAS domain S-box-containing protein/putative nucleotidyltransferase with HDIG domain
MRGQHKTIEQSIKEPQELCQRSTELEATESQRKKSEEALRQSENKYRFLVDNIKEIILIISKRGKIIFANKSTLTNYGYSQDELIGKSITKFLTRDCFKTVLFALAQEFLGRPQAEIEVRAKTKSGEIRYLKVAEGSVPIYDNGKLMGKMISATDITEHRRAEEKLRESEARFKELWDNAPVAYHTLDIKGIITSVNQTEAKMLGYTKEEMIGKFIFEFISPEQREEAQKRYQQKISGHYTPKAENRIYVKNDGSKIYVLIDDVLERDENGKVIGIWTTMVDVTRDKEIAVALRISEERYRDLVEKAGIAIAIEDKKENLKFANKRYAEIFGYSMEEMKKQSIQSLVHPDDVERVMGYHTGRLQGKKVPSRYEFRGIRKDGAIIHIEVDANARREGENLIETRSYLRDITERKQAEEILQKQNAQLDLIRHIQSEIPMNTDMETILVRAAESIGKSFGYYKISVNLYDRETKEIEYLTGWNKTGLPIPRGHRQKLGQGLIGKAGLLKQTIVANDVSKEPDYISFHLPETKAEIIIPLLVQNQLLGVLDVQATQVGAFSKEDVSVLQAVANYIAYIIDEKQQEEVLRKERDKAQKYLDIAGVMIVVLDPSAKVTLINKKGCEILGYPEQEIIGKNWFETYLPAQIKDEMYLVFQKLVAGEIESVEYYENPVLTHCGEERIIVWHNIPLKDEAGNIISVLRSGEDITELRQAEQEAQRRTVQAELLYKVGQRVSSKLELQALLSEIATSIRDTFDYYGVMLLLLDEQEKVLHLQSIMGGYAQIFSGDQKIEIGKGMIGYAAASGEIQVSGDVSTYPHYCRWKNEETKSELSVPIKSGDKVIGVLDIQSDDYNAFDETDVRAMRTLSTQIAEAIENARLYERAQKEIAERKQAEEMLRESEAKLRTILEAVYTGIVVIDPETHTIVDVNSVAARLIGEPKERIVSSICHSYICLAEKGKCPITDLGQEVDNSERVLINTSGKRIPILKTVVPITLGGRKHLLESFVDIAEQKRAEEALRESEEKFRNMSDSAQDVILMMDHKGDISYWNKAAEKVFGFSAQEALGKKLHLFLAPQEFQAAYREAFDKFKTIGQGSIVDKTIELKAIRKDRVEIPIELSVSAIRLKGEWNAIGIIRDITERKLAKEQLEKSYENLRKAMNGIIQAIALTVERRDPYTAGHQRRVADLARAIATEMALSKDQIEGTRIAGVIHDIGKISIPAEILSKPSSLNEPEFSLIKDHSKVGYEILKEIEFPWPIAQIVYQHHERMDGSGYPQGLSGEDILLEARILGVADTVEAMTTHRPYRPALGLNVALEEISRNKGRLYDPRVVEACLKVFTEKNFEFK